MAEDYLLLLQEYDYQTPPEVARDAALAIQQQIPVVGGGTQFAFVYAPGGTPGPSTFTTVAALMVALNAAAPVDANGQRPPTLILVNDNFVNTDGAHPALWPLGSYNLTNVEFRGVANFNTNTGFSVLEFQAGVTITGATDGGTIFATGGLTVQFAGAAACISCAANQEWNIFLREDAILACAGAGVFLNVLAGGFGFIDHHTGAIGDGVHAVANASAAGSSLTVHAYSACFVEVGAITGANSTVYWDNTVPGAQGAGVTIVAVNGYAPAAPAQWHTAPTQQSNALDILESALSNHNQQTSAVAGPANPLVSTALSCTPRVSGKIRVHVSTTCSSAAADDTILATLLADGVAVVGAPTPQMTATLIGDKVTLTIDWDITLTLAAHTIAVEATSGAAANLSGTQQVVKWQELSN